MKTSSPLNLPLRLIATILSAAMLMLSAPTSHAASATWLANPFTGSWNDPANWTVGGPPYGSDTATFASSNTTGVFLSLNTEVNRIVFNAGASAFTITASPAFALTISGVGITNNSGITQNFVTAVDGGGNSGIIYFTSSATAGSATFFVNNGAALSGGQAGVTVFVNTSTADHGTFESNGATVTGGGGSGVQFFDSSTADHGTFIINGATVTGGVGGAFTNFNNTSTAGSGTFTLNGGGVSGADSGGLVFLDTATAGNGTFTCNAAAFSGSPGSLIRFQSTSTASNGTFTNNGSQVSGAGPGVTQFIDSSTAGNGIFTNNGGAASGAGYGFTSFSGSSTAANGTFTNNGGAATGVGGGGTFFGDTATAGSGTFTHNSGLIDGAGGGFAQFGGTATAGNSIFTNNGGAVSGAFGSYVAFFDSATAGSGTFTNNGGAVSGAEGTNTQFQGTSTAGNGIFTNNGGAVSGAFGGLTIFFDTSTMGNGTFIANGGSGGGFGGRVLIGGDQTGGTARVEIFGNGAFDISFHNAPGLTTGSIEGSGNVFLGATNLTVGSNNLSTTFSGVIQDGGDAGGTGGSFTKIGSGTLRLSGANTYTGNTIVDAGRLLANNSTGSGTGSGAVTVNNSGSVLGGTGTISGPVIVNNGAAILGGNATTASGSLKVANNVTLNSGSIIQLVLGASGAHSTLTRTAGTWTFAANQKFTFLDVGAQPGFYDNIITGLAAAPPGTASWTITNTGFAGTFAYDGAGNIDLNLTSALGPALQLSSAVSRKTHGGAGTFNVPLPLTGEPGVECRNSGGNHTLVFTFNNNVVSGNASVTSGAASVTGSPTFVGNVMTVNLTGVTDIQKITVTLSNVTDTSAQVLPDTAVSVNMLVGDTNGNKTVNASDVAQTKAQSGAPVTAANFRTDVNASGAVSASDVAQVKANAGHTLP